MEEKSLSEEEKKEMLTKDISELMSGKGELIAIDSLPLFADGELKKFYLSRSNEPFWVSTTGANELGKSMLGILDSAWSYGFDPDWYFLLEMREKLDTAASSENYVLKSRMLAETDVLLTNAFFLHVTHLKEGFIDTADMSVKWKKDSLGVDIVKYLEETDVEHLSERVYAFQPNNIEYRQLQFALAKYWRANELWDEHFEVPEPKKDSIGFWKVAKEVLVKLKYLDTATVKTDSLVVAALKLFQEKNVLDADGKPGKQSVWSLRLSNYDRFLMAAIAMEKWRWKNRTAEMQIRVNIPSYELNLIRNDSIKHRARVVTGLPDHETPELRAKVKYFTLYPYWHVPHSISTKEILPFAKRDTNYLHKHNYQIFDLKNNPVSISSVNWKRLSTDYFPYKIRQNGGVTNSLGLIVFYFPNKYDVYLHDTPSKNFFNRTVRSFSHGCMRLQDPFKLGEIIMKEERKKDTITADTLRAWALRDGEKRYPLKKHIPIEVDYITTTADSLGNIFFHYDVYGRDEKYLKILRQLKID